MAKSVIYDDDYQEFLNYSHFHSLVYEGISYDNYKLDFYIIEKMMPKYDRVVNFCGKMKDSVLYNFLVAEIPKTKKIKLEVSHFLLENRLCGTTEFVANFGDSSLVDTEGQLGKRGMTFSELDLKQNRKYQLESEIFELMDKMKSLSMSIKPAEDSLDFVKNQISKKSSSAKKNNDSDQPENIQNPQNEANGFIENKKDKKGPNQFISASENSPHNLRAEYFKGKNKAYNLWRDFDDMNYEPNDVLLIEDMQQKLLKVDYIIMDTGYIEKYLNGNKIIAEVHERVLLEYVDFIMNVSKASPCLQLFGVLTKSSVMILENKLFWTPVKPGF